MTFYPAEHPIDVRNSTARTATSNLESIEYKTESAKAPEAPGWFKVGVLAAVSVLAGGLAVGWYYRNTLSQLRQAANREPELFVASAEDDGI